MKMKFTIDVDYQPLYFTEEDIFDLINKSNIKAMKAEICV